MRERIPINEFIERCRTNSRVKGIYRGQTINESDPDKECLYLIEKVLWSELFGKRRILWEDASYTPEIVVTGYEISGGEVAISNYHFLTTHYEDPRIQRITQEQNLLKVAS